MTLHELQRRLANFDQYAIVKEVIEETKEDIAKLNQGQLFLGVNRLNKEIINIQTGSPFYSVRWADERRRAGLQTKHFDLRFTGSFWNSITVDEITKDTFRIHSTEEGSEKVNNIFNLFSDFVLGLTDQSRTEEYIPLYFNPLLQAKIKQKLGLKFE